MELKIIVFCLAVIFLGIVVCIKAIQSVQAFMDDSFRWGNKENSRKDDIL